MLRVSASWRVAPGTCLTPKQMSGIRIVIMMGEVRRQGNVIIWCGETGANM